MDISALAEQGPHLPTLPMPLLVIGVILFVVITIALIWTGINKSVDRELKRQDRADAHATTVFNRMMEVHRCFAGKYMPGKLHEALSKVAKDYAQLRRRCWLQVKSDSDVLHIKTQADALLGDIDVALAHKPTVEELEADAKALAEKLAHEEGGFASKFANLDHQLAERVRRLNRQIEEVKADNAQRRKQIEEAQAEVRTRLAEASRQVAERIAALKPATAGAQDTTPASGADQAPPPVTPQG